MYNYYGEAVGTKQSKRGIVEFFLLRTYLVRTYRKTGRITVVRSWNKTE